MHMYATFEICNENISGAVDIHMKREQTWLPHDEHLGYCPHY